MDKISVAILGATGAVGQRFVQLLAEHPWFEITALTGSDRTIGGKYGEVCRWVLDEDPPESVREMTVSSTEPTLPARILFSALPSHIAKGLEPVLAQTGYIVCSNASAYRQEPDVPLIIPEINADHLSLIECQKTNRGWDGVIVTSPNCTTTGLAMTLHPLHQAIGISQVFVTSMQAVSGAGYPGVPYLDIVDNIIPYISGEEDKLQSETRLLLGRVKGGKRLPAGMRISAQTNRVPVVDGHTLSIALKLDHSASVEEVLQVYKNYQGHQEVHNLPSAPEKPILVRIESDRPQPRRDRDSAAGMSVSVGRIRPCPILDYRMVSVVHNTLRGAASGSIFNAELLVSKGYLN